MESDVLPITAMVLFIGTFGFVLLRTYFVKTEASVRRDAQLPLEDDLQIKGSTS